MPDGLKPPTTPTSEEEERRRRRRLNLEATQRDEPMPYPAWGLPVADEAPPPEIFGIQELPEEEEPIFGVAEVIPPGEALAEIGAWLQEEQASPEPSDDFMRFATLVDLVYPELTRPLGPGELGPSPPTTADAIQTVFRLAIEDTPGFIESLRSKGRSAGTEILLTELYPDITEEDIAAIFAPIQGMFPLDGVNEQLEIDTETGQAYNQQGEWVGSYNPVTKEFTSLPEESKAKDILDAARFAAAGAWTRTKGFFLSTVPNLIFRDMTAIERKNYGDAMADYIDAGSRDLRNKFRLTYAKNQEEFEEWTRKHPELQPRKEWEEGAFQHPELLKDPYYFAYELSSITPYMAASMVAATAVTAATGGNVLAGVAAAGAVMIPSETEAVKQELLAAGMPEEHADPVALATGSLIGALEGLGHLPIFKAVSPHLMRLFRREAGKQMAKATVKQLVKKGATTGVVSWLAETGTEVLQEAAANAAIKIADENKDLFEGLADIATKAGVAMFIPSLFGAGASMVRVSPSQTQGLSKSEIEAKGWEVEPKTGNIYEPIKLPKAEPELVVPEVVPPVPVKPKRIVPPEVVPVAERGMPEAGIQKALLPGVSEKVVRPEAKAPTVQAKLDDYLKLKEYEADLTTTRMAEIDKLLEVKGKLSRGMGTKETLRIERARLEAQQDVAQATSAEDIQSWIAEIETELGARSLPFHGRLKAKFPDMTTKQLDEMVKVYNEALGVLEAKPAVTEVVKPPPPRHPRPPIAERVPPPPEGAAKRVFERIELEPAEVGMAEKIKRGWHTFNVKMVDDLYALKKFTEEATKGGTALSIEENPYILARLLKGINSKATVFLEKGTFGKTFWKVEKGRAVPNFTGESLETILKEVREPTAWQDFSTYLVARRAFELADRNIKTGIEQTDAIGAIEELEDKYPNFDGLAKRVYKYEDSLLVYAQQMGLISKDLIEKLRHYGNYVPFYRVFNELQAKGFMGKKMANIASPIKKIKGSEREILNPLESIVKNTYVLISAADRNRIGIMMANLVDQNPDLVELFERVKTPMARVARVTAEDLGVEIEGLSDKDTEQVVDIFRPSFFMRGDEVTVLIDGEKKYFKIDSDLRDALLHLDRESLGMLGKFISLPAKWLRAGATLSPDFMVRNPMRDQMTAFVYSNYGFLPGIDFLRGVAGIIRKDADYQLYRSSGAEHSMLVSMDRQYLQTTFKEIVEGKKFTNYIKHPLELFQIVSTIGEKTTRLGEFKKGLDRGAIPLEAGYSSRNVSLDFAQAGTTAHALNRIIAFFNANIRGWTKMISSFKEHPVRTSAKIFGGITLPSILLYYANRDDERWKEIPQWQKDLFWLIMTKDNIYRIPKPFELGIIFGSGPERFLEWLDSKDPKLMKEVLLNVAEAGSPGWMPQALLPIIEGLTNYNFFRGQKIVPASRERMPPELQYTRWTSQVSRKLGELLKYPPAKIDNFIHAWTGGLGRYATQVLDGILKGTGISPDMQEPSPTLADRPVIKAFVVRDPFEATSETTDRFYDTLEEYEKGEKYLKEMMELGEEEKFEKFKAAHPELLFFMDFEKGVFYSASARYLRRVARDLSELRKKQDEVYKSSELTSKQKRELIDKINRAKYEVARRALDLFLGEQPPVLQHQLSEAENKLGEVIGEVPILSQDEPDIFTMRKLSGEYANLLEAIKWEDLEGEGGLPKTVQAWFEKEEGEKGQQSYGNDKIYKINPDPKKGSTFEDYYQQWQERQRITDPEKLAQHKRDYPQAYLGNLTKRQLSLIRKYHSANEEEQRKMLEKYPELSVNPRNEWLRDNPGENAKLAIWGQAKILTQEAYDEFQRLIKVLDIPDDAIPELTMPPKGSVANYFTYLKEVEDRSAGSWEVKLLIAKDNNLRKFLGREPIEEPIVVLELQVADRGLYDREDLLRETLPSVEDPDNPDYKTGYQYAIAQLKEANPEWVDDMRRVEALKEGTNEEPTPENIVEGWVKRGREADKFEASSAEVKVWMADNLEIYRWALDKGLLTDDGGLPDDDPGLAEGRKSDKWNIPKLLLKKKWRDEDTGYDALTADEERVTWISDPDKVGWIQDWLDDRYRTKAYSWDMDIPIKKVEAHVAYSRLEADEDVLRAQVKLFLSDDKTSYYDMRVAIPKGEDGHLEPIEKERVPIWRIDVAHEKDDAWYDQGIVEKHEGIEDEKERNKAIAEERTQYLVDTKGNPTIYARKRRERDFYGLSIEPVDKRYELRDEFVEYKLIPQKGFRGERYLSEHSGLYKLLRDKAIMGDNVLTALDFSKIPNVKYDELREKIEQGKGSTEDELMMEAYGLLLDYKDPQLVGKYVKYYMKPVKGMEQELYLKENPDLAGALDLQISDKHIESLRISVQYEKLFDLYNSYTDKGKKDMLVANPEFTRARKLRDAYDKGVPDKYVEEYADFYLILEKGKPAGWQVWFEDDRYLQRHPQFYTQVYLGILKREPIQFDKIPTRKWEIAYSAVYSELRKADGSADRDTRYQYRGNNPWFDAEGVRLGFWKPYKAPALPKKAPATPYKAPAVPEKPKAPPSWKGYESLIRRLTK